TVRCSAASCEDVEHDVAIVLLCSDLMYPLDELRGLHGVEHIVCVFELDELKQLLLRLLCVPNFVIGPKRLGYNASLDFGQESLERGHVISVCAPPDAAFAVECLELCLG